MTDQDFLEDLNSSVVQTIVDIYPYTDEKGNVLYDKIRIEPGPNGKKKDFRIRRYENPVTQAYPNIGATGNDIFYLPQGVSWGMGDCIPVLFNLPIVTVSNEIVITEGEKDAKTAISLGYTATCIVDGSSGEWHPQYTKYFTGKNVVVFEDIDKDKTQKDGSVFNPGKKFGRTVRENLEGKANSICFVRVPVPEGEDLTDYVVKHGATRENCDSLILSARLPQNSELKKTIELVQRKGSPSANESEKLIIGVLIMGIEPIDEIVCSLSPENFNIEAHSKIYECLLDLAKEGVEADKTALVQRLQDIGILELVGGVEYIVDLTDDLPPAYNLNHHIEVIVKKSQSRDLLTSIMGSAEKLVLGTDIEKVRADINKALDQVDQSSLAYRSGPVHVVEVLGSDDNFFKPAPQGILSNLRDLNHWSNGIHPGELLVIAARPSCGKTSLANQIAACASLNSNNVDIFAYEERKEIHLKKVICSMAKVPYSRLRNGWLTAEERRRISLAKKALEQTNLRITDATECGNWLPKDYRNYLKQRVAQKDPVRVLMIDYLQLMRLPNADRHDIKIGMITRDLKLMANEFGITIILLSQLSRAGEKENRKPTLSDLRDSGSIEADANSVLFIWQDKKENEDPCSWRDAELIAGKLREGPQGTIKVKFWKPFTVFVNDDYFEAKDDKVSYLIQEVHANYSNRAIVA